MSREEVKKRLIEDLGVHFENMYQIPPLAARLYASLVLTEQEGLTFEDCQLRRGASKSSISSALNLLLKMEIISYFTKPGDRKRYFKVSESGTFFLNKLKERLKLFQAEKEIIYKINDYHEQYNPEKHRKNQPKTSVYLNFVTESEKLLNQSIDKLKSFKED